MKILISGSSGFIGSNLCSFFDREDNEVYRLVRDKKQLDEKAIYWNPEKGLLNAAVIENFDCVIHLAGENIASKRWTSKQKFKIKNSRITGTKLLAKAISGLKSSPQVFLCASATGFYGDCGEDSVNESCPVGQGFLSNVCNEWEAAAVPAQKAGIRVIHLRFGMVLSSKGGALAKMLVPFKLGVGGIIGNGKQYLPWITIDDAISAIDFIIKNAKIDGAVNIAAPNPVTNKYFTKALGKALRRPTVLPLPALMAKIVLGEMADELLLSSARVIPEKLIENGFKFTNEYLSDAFNDLIVAGG